MKSFNKDKFLDIYLAAYKTGQTTRQCAERIGINSIVFNGRVASLKKKGIRLPKLRRATAMTQEEVDRLNAKIDKALRDLGGK